LVDKRLIVEAPETGAASVTVQLPDEPATTTVGTHARAVSTAGTVSEIVCVRVTLPATAVTATDWAAAIAPAAALNVALLPPAGTVTAAGTVSAAAELLSATETSEVPGPLSVTVHRLACALVKVAGEQTKVRKTMGAATVTVPEVAVTATAVPAGDAPKAFVTPMVVFPAPAAKVTVTIATTPFRIGDEFRP